jgi:hypothetical protein
LQQLVGHGDLQSHRRQSRALGTAPNITITVTAPTTPGSITNSATVSSPNDNTPANNTASATTTVRGADTHGREDERHMPARAASTRRFNWSIQVSNIGQAIATFANADVILTDNLPAGPLYGTPTVSSSGTTGTISCSIVTNDLTCAASGPVTIPTASSFHRQLQRHSRPTSTTLVNPRSAGICRR